MRIFKKYKIWFKSTNEFFPLRLLKFKKSKWKKLKKFLLKFKKKQFFFDYSTTVLQTKTWERVKSSFKNSLKHKYSLKNRYDSTFNIKSTNLNFELQFFTNNFLKKEYNIDTLLWRLRFFNSIYQAKQSLKNGLVFLNNKCIQSDTYVLNKGDIISLKKSSFSSSQQLRRELNFSFLECDYYTQTIIILKDFNSLSKKDILCFFRESYPLNILKNLK